MKILISGASGYVGSHLVPFLQKTGYQVDQLVREDGEGVLWDPSKGEIDPEKIEGYDAVINLTGENVGSGRWTERKKQRIRDSRVLSTLTLVKAIQQLKKKPKVFINASAVGYYATETERLCDESTSKGRGFLSDVCLEKEDAALPLEEIGVRVVQLRIGVVLSRNGGALQQMLIPFRLCLGGVLGSGRQYMSWISMDDLIRIIQLCLEDKRLSGPVNAVSPNPVTNKTFTKTLGKVLWRPTIFWMPKWVVKLVFGEMGQELFLTSTRAIPRKLQDAGFAFKKPELRETLEEE